MQTIQEKFARGLTLSDEEFQRERFELDVLHLQNNFLFCKVFALFLNRLCDSSIHPLAAEILKGPSPVRAFAIAECYDRIPQPKCDPARGLTAESLTDYFEGLADLLYMGGGYDRNPTR